MDEEEIPAIQRQPVCRSSNLNSKTYASAPARKVSSPQRREPARTEAGLNWLQEAVDTLGLVPGLNVPAEIVSGGISLFRGDLAGVFLSVVGLMPITGEWAVAVKLVRGYGHLSRGARYGARLAYHAEKRARAAEKDAVRSQRRPVERASFSL
ncbi:MAG TPA: hypothetical protein VKT32_09660 [Chthonomonadaceae bacterium]|nr:hypothetical protein [Chthonomonadaceae bacterium]